MLMLTMIRIYFSYQLDFPMKCLALFLHQDLSDSLLFCLLAQPSQGLGANTINTIAVMAVQSWYLPFSIEFPKISKSGDLGLTQNQAQYFR